MLYYLGDYEGAKSLFERAMTSNEKNFGKDHPTTAASYWWMATILAALGQFEQALEFCEKAVEIYNKTLPKDHPDIKRVNNTYQSIKEKMEGK